MPDQKHKADVTRDPDLTRDYVPQVKYLCVCGHETLVGKASGATCSSCRRRFPASLLQGDPALTMGVDAKGVTRNHAESSAADSRIGEVLGHYRIVAALGSGGMGTVYRALDESLQRYVAIKVIRATLDSQVDAHHVQRLLQEAIAQARVNHPNIAHIYYVGREQESPFFAMELINGPTLAQRLSDAPLHFAEVIEYAQQIIGALSHAAKFDILHGDIKPGNILLSDARTVKLSDFGLARRLSEMDKSAGTVAGTPAYLAPEAFTGVPLDVRSDMYALGVMLFEMTFGRLPYANSGSSISERLRAHQEHPVDFPDPWPTSVPRAWRDVLEKLLCKNPADRYPTYEALLSDVTKLKPVTLHAAARLPRGMAWMVDLALTNAVIAIFVAPVALVMFSWETAETGILPLAAALLAIPGLLLAALLQSVWGKTPGKKLFQLRIVDRHGVVPHRSVLFARMAMQLLPVWADINFDVWTALGMSFVAQSTTGLLALVSVADILCGLFHWQKKSLHDLLFRTRVVLDTTQHE
jgi:uncharacterized RDD family membrane protein YckC